MIDFEVTVRIRNNQLKERRLALGLSGSKLAERIGVSYGAYVALEGLRSHPMTRHRGGVIGWRSVAEKIASFYRVPPDVLWPEAIRAVRKSETVAKIEGAQLAAFAKLANAPRLLAESPDKLLEDKRRHEGLRKVLDSGTLSPRDREVIVRIYGLDGHDEHTLGEVAEVFGWESKERPRQIRERALQRLRHPTVIRAIDDDPDALDNVPEWDRRRS